MAQILIFGILAVGANGCRNSSESRTDEMFPRSGSMAHVIISTWTQELQSQQCRGQHDLNPLSRTQMENPGSQSWKLSLQCSQGQSTIVECCKILDTFIYQSGFLITFNPGCRNRRCMGHYTGVFNECKPSNKLSIEVGMKMVQVQEICMGGQMLAWQNYQFAGHLMQDGLDEWRMLKAKSAASFSNQVHWHPSDDQAGLHGDFGASCHKVE
jgi:hypothetical protein